MGGSSYRKLMRYIAFVPHCFSTRVYEHTIKRPVWPVLIFTGESLSSRVIRNPVSHDAVTELCSGELHCGILNICNIPHWHAFTTLHSMWRRQSDDICDLVDAVVAKQLTLNRIPAIYSSYALIKVWLWLCPLLERQVLMAFKGRHSQREISDCVVFML